MSWRPKLAGWLFLPAALYAQGVAGTVLNSATGAPVAGVTIEIQQDGKTVYQAVSDGQGAFRIDGMAPGGYNAKYSKSGFREPDRNAPARRTFHVSAGSDPVQLEASVLPLGSVSGRVLGTDGAPMAQAAVQLLLKGNFIGQFGTGDEKGAFSFHDIDPGTYTLSARAPKSAAPPAPDGEQRRVWARTYYPSVPFASGAALIELPPGAELSNRDIQMVAEPVHLVRGRVLTDSGEPAVHVSVKLTSAAELGADNGTETRAGDDGTFEFPDAYDGPWRLKASLESKGVEWLASGALRIAGRDIDGLELRLSTTFEVNGKVVAEAPAGAPLPNKFSVVLAPQEGGDHIPNGATRSGGSFLIDGVIPGAYKITPISPGPSLYLASIQVGSREVLGDFVEITPGMLPITVTYKSNGGTVRGSVEDCGEAVIVLAPQEPRLQTPDFIRRASCQQGGRFELSNLRPGEYYAFAFEQAPGMIELYMYSKQSLVNLAERVTVRAGESSQIALKVIARGAY
jgi:hypothetical protein